MELSITTRQDSLIGSKLWLRAPGKRDGDPYDCRDASLTRDSIRVRCVATPLGEVRVAGRFQAPGAFGEHLFTGDVYVLSSPHRGAVWHGSFVPAGVD